MMPPIWLKLGIWSWLGQFDFEGGYYFMPIGFFTSTVISTEVSGHLQGSAAAECSKCPETERRNLESMVAPSVAGVSVYAMTLLVIVSAAWLPSA